MSNPGLLWKSSQSRLHLSRSWSPASSGPKGDRVRPRCQTRCCRWSWTPPCLPYLHTEKGGVRKQRTGSGGDRVGDEVGSIVNQRGTKTADRVISIFDDKPKNKRRWKDRGRHPVRLTPFTVAPSLTASPQGRTLLFTPPTRHPLPSFMSSSLCFCGVVPLVPVYLAALRSG